MPDLTVAARLARIANEPTLELTHYGRKTGQPRRLAKKRQSGAGKPLLGEAIEGLPEVQNEMDLPFAILAPIDLTVSLAVGGGIDRLDPLAQGLHHRGIEILR